MAAAVFRESCEELAAQAAAISTQVSQLEGVTLDAVSLEVWTAAYWPRPCMQSQTCQGGQAALACSVPTEAHWGPSAARWLQVLAMVLRLLNKCGLLLLPEPVCSQPAQSVTRPLTRQTGWQELLGHCTALYQENHRRICDLERHLRQYGYKAEFLAPQLGQTRTSGSEEAVVGPGASVDPSIVSSYPVTGFVRSVSNKLA